MKTLLEDYKRKLQTAEEFISNNKNNGSIHDEKRKERLNTKASEYRSFIVDIERAIEREKEKTISDENNGDGSYNILRKAVPNAFADGIEGIGVYPEIIKISK